MLMDIAGATGLMTTALRTAGYSGPDADIITDHLIDCELRGLEYGGLARGLSVVERVQGQSHERGSIEVVRSTPVSSTLNGGDEVGYLVAQRATTIALELASRSGIAVVGAHNTWYTGMFSYYLEQITSAGLVGMIAGSGSHIVAPAGSSEARFCTNPVAFGFPTATENPVIWDIGTSETMVAEVLLALRLGQSLPEGRLYNAQGEPSTTPADLLGGALTVWGGHKGSGLAVVVQMLGALAGASYAPEGLSDCGFLLLAIDPAILTDADDFKERTSVYADSVRAARPLDPDRPVRMPFDRSSAQRDRRRALDQLEINDEVVAALQTAAGTAT
ncbi:MAG: Ldh family oxidoreductase [Actinomycetota bacterium]|nr:Ldh family oxidoreductase [Actinomycetota bacterium]